jgi:hypothetical protein
VAAVGGGTGATLPNAQPTNAMLAIAVFSRSPDSGMPVPLA